MIILFISIPFISAIAISSFDKSRFIDAFFESISAATNTGLSTGITNMNMGLISKTILTVNMIVGRFEIIVILYIFIGALRR